ncbi:MAG: DUF481 domain-containing protein [Bacteroidales bacterium]
MKQVKLFVIFISFLNIVLASSLFAQVNTEKFRKHAKTEGFIFSAGFGFGYSAGNSDYVSADASARVDYNGKSNNAFLVGNFDYKESNKEKAVHKGFLHFRGIRPLTPGLALEGFLQQQFDQFLLLNDRKLIGTSLRIRTMDFRSVKDTLTGLSSYLGLGIMYEREVYNVGLETEELVKKEPLRISSYLTFDYAISERINCWVVGYYQPKIDRFDNFKAVLEAGMEISIIGRLFFTFDLGYRFISEPVGDVEKYDVVIKNGLRVTIP